MSIVHCLTFRNGLNTILNYFQSLYYVKHETLFSRQHNNGNKKGRFDSKQSIYLSNNLENSSHPGSYLAV